jgi:cobalt-zinc-cadmium efflux system protein
MVAAPDAASCRHRPGDAKDRPGDGRGRPAGHAHAAHDGHAHGGHAHDGHAHAAHDGHAHEAHDGHVHEAHDGHAHAAHDGHAHEAHDGHRHHDLRALGRRALVGSLWLNGAFLIVELVVGAATGSLALLSDAVHMLSDVAGLAVAVAAASVRLRPRDGSATFGHGRFAVLGGLVNGALSLLAAVVIVVEAVDRLRQPPPVPGLPVLVTAAAGLVVNLVSAWWLHRSGDRGVNMRGALLHMLGDALGSVAALAAGATLLLGGPDVVDAIVSVVVAAIVAASAVPLLRDALHILLERVPRRLDPARVRAVLHAHPAVADVAGLHVWDLDDGETLASFVLTTREPELARLAAAADELRDGLRGLGIVHATFEWRPDDGAVGGCCPPEPDKETVR